MQVGHKVSPLHLFEVVIRVYSISTFYNKIGKYIMESNLKKQRFLLTFGEESNRSEIRDLPTIEAVVSLHSSSQKLSFECSFTNEFGEIDVVVNLVEVKPEIIQSAIALVKLIGHDLIDGSGEFQDEQQPELLEKARTTVEVALLNLSELSCLYIEDQVDSQILFKTQLKELKNIELAENFEKALLLINSKKFDFIVMDINLPGEHNGMDAMKLFRQIPGHEEDIIIATTAYVLPGDKDKFILAGFDGFISGPVFKEKLVEEIENLLEKKLQPTS